MPVTFSLRARYSTCESASIQVGRYPDRRAGFGWQVFGDCGNGYEEPLGSPTVNMADYGEYPAEGCVFIKVTNEYIGYLQSLQDGGIVGVEIRPIAAAYTGRYAVEVSVLNAELRAQMEMPPLPVEERS